MFLTRTIKIKEELQSLWTDSAPSTSAAIFWLAHAQMHLGEPRCTWQILEFICTCAEFFMHRKRGPKPPWSPHPRACVYESLHMHRCAEGFCWVLIPEKHFSTSEHMCAMPILPRQERRKCSTKIKKKHLCSIIVEEGNFVFWGEHLLKAHLFGS